MDIEIEIEIDIRLVNSMRDPSLHMLFQTNPTRSVNNYSRSYR